MLVPRNKRGQIQHRLERFGRSRLGAPLEVWLPLEGPIDFLLIAGMHGDEAETTIILSTALRSLPAEELRSAVILGANPDGLSRGTRGDAEGVDLNRNFPAANWSPKLVNHRWSAEDPQDVELSPGPSPASEPETTALMDLVERFKPPTVVSFHGMLACIDDPAQSPLAEWMSRKTGLPLVPDIGYATPGSFGSWAKEKNLPLITYEIAHESVKEHRQKHEPVVMALLRGHQAIDL